MKRRIAIYAAAVSACAFLFIGGLYLTNATGFLRSGEVSAQELVDDMIDKVGTLNPDQIQQIEGRMKADIETSLEEARNAPDLQFIPEERLERFDIPKNGPMGMGIKPNGQDKIILRHPGTTEGGTPDPNVTVIEEVTPDGARKTVTFKRKIDGDPNATEQQLPRREDTPNFFDGTGKIPVPRDVKYVLQYTNPEGAKVLLGVDRNDTPVMKMMEMKKVIEGSGEAGFHFR